MNTSEIVETDILVEELEKLVDEREIILFNDDVNTFDHVIDSLVKYCKHEPVQAEQCAYIVHYNGKCGVKKGHYNKLRPICEALLEKGLSAEIQ
jgi:ATP-dependent Clp protease adaptor protein ClpS